MISDSVLGVPLDVGGPVWTECWVSSPGGVVAVDTGSAGWRRRPLGDEDEDAANTDRCRSNSVKSTPSNNVIP